MDLKAVMMYKVPHYAFTYRGKLLVSRVNIQIRQGPRFQGDPVGCQDLQKYFGSGVQKFNPQTPLFCFHRYHKSSCTSSLSTLLKILLLVSGTF